MKLRLAIYIIGILFIGVLIQAITVERYPATMGCLFWEADDQLVTTVKQFHSMGSAEQATGTSTPGIILPYDITVVAMTGCFRTSCTGGMVMKLDTNRQVWFSDSLEHGSGVQVAMSTGLNMPIKAGKRITPRVQQLCSSGGDGHLFAIWYLYRIDGSVKVDPY